MHKYISSKHWTAKDLRLKFSNVNSPPPLFLTFSLSPPYLCVIKLFSATNYNHALLKIIKKFSLGCADVKEFIACLFFSFASLILWEFSERCYCSFLRLFFFREGGNLDILSHLINDAHRLILFMCVYDFYRPQKVCVPVKLGAPSFLYFLLNEALSLWHTHTQIISFALVFVTLSITKTHYSTFCA